MLSREIGGGDVTEDDGARDIDVEWEGQGGYELSIPESIIRGTIQDQGPDTVDHDKAS